MPKIIQRKPKILSEWYSLNKEDYKRWLVKVVTFWLPVLWLYLQQLQAWQVDLTALYVFTIWALFDLGRRYIRELEASK